MAEIVERRRLGKENDLSRILKSTRQYYSAFSDQYAKFYDAWLSGEGHFSDPEYKMGYDRVSTILTGLVDDGQLIIDIGCGVGTWSILMAKRRANVVGLDHSIEALSTLRRRSKKANADYKTSCIIGDGLHIPFKDGIFNGSTLNWVLAHIPTEKNRKFVEGIRRVLKGNAWLMISDSFWREQEGGKEQFQIRKTDKGTFEVYKYYYTPEELQHRLESTLGKVEHVETTPYEMLCVARKSQEKQGPRNTPTP